MTCSCGVKTGILFPDGSTGCVCPGTTGGFNKPPCSSNISLTSSGTDSIGISPSFNSSKSSSTSKEGSSGL